MRSRRTFERQQIKYFLTYFFWSLEEWVDSIKYGQQELESTSKKLRWEMSLKRGYRMRLSSLMLVLDRAYKRLYAPDLLAEEDAPYDRESVLNDQLERIVDPQKRIFEFLESSISVAQSPQVIIQESFGDTLLSYVIWWILDAWPESNVRVDFVVDEEKVRMIFQDPDRAHTSRDNEGHEILGLWSALIDYFATVEYHGICIWPQPGETRRLEVIWPLRPPTDEELDGPLPEWIEQVVEGR